MATAVRGRNTRSLAQQALGLRSIFPDSRVDLRPHALTWTGSLQPTDLSRTYTVRIGYRLGRYPQVRVRAPELRATESGFLPHTYDDGTLCLHEAHQWNAGMLIVDTTIPWAAEWLFHYETWLALGYWYGDVGPSPALPSHYNDLPALNA